MVHWFIGYLTLFQLLLYPFVYIFLIRYLYGFVSVFIRFQIGKVFNSNQGLSSHIFLSCLQVFYESSLCSFCLNCPVRTLGHHPFMRDFNGTIFVSVCYVYLLCRSLLELEISLHFLQYYSLNFLSET
jgi:hypothetical protein